jgi:uncharacterized membrane protein YdjX (TVP38/TMEM64 family)
MKQNPAGMTDPQGSTLRLGAFFIAFSIVIAVPFLIWGDRIEASLGQERLVAWFAESAAFAWLVAMGLLVLDLVLPIPNTMVMAALGSIYGPLLGGLVSALGNCLSGLLGYALCRRFGRPLAIRLVSRAEIDRNEKLFARSGGWIVAASRWLPVFSEVIVCMAGLGKMRLSTFTFALVSGAAPLGFTVATLGHAGSAHPMLILALCAVLPLPLWFLTQVLSTAQGGRRASPGRSSTVQ